MPARTPKLRPVDGDPSDAASSEEEDAPEERMRLTADRILVRVPDDSERKSKAGLLIPATAATPLRRCVWSEVVLAGPEARNARAGDRVLFIPHTGLEVEWKGETYLLLRERDIQAVASDHRDPGTGQYL
jgi:chaperonin GroES